MERMHEWEQFKKEFCELTGRDFFFDEEALAYVAFARAWNIAYAYGYDRGLSVKQAEVRRAVLGETPEELA